MVLKSDQARVKALLKETITLLCKNGLSYQSEFCIEALIGITLDHDEVFLVSIKETIAADKACRTTHDSDSDQQEPDICITAVQTHTNNTSRKRPMRTPPRQEMEAATRQTWSPSGGHSIRSVTESNIANATPIHTYSSTSFLKSHSRKRTQVCDGNVGSPSLTNQSDSSLSSDNDRVSRDCNLSNRLQGEGHWEGHSTEEPPPKKAVKDRNPPTTDSFNDKYTQEIDSKSNILNSDILVIKEESSKEDCSESYSLSSGTLQPAGMPNVLASLAASLTQGPLGTYTGPSAATSWEQLPHVSRGSYLTSTGHSASQDSIPSMPMHLGVTQPVNLLEALGSTAQTPVDMTMYFTSLAAAILRLEGSFVPVRVIKRKHQRFSTDEIVMVMKMMTTPQNSDEFVGEFRQLAHKVKIFYKCPPQLIKKPGLEKYNLTIEEYKEQYHKDPRPAKGGPYDWDSYLKIVMENSPFISYPSYGFYSVGGANVTVQNNAITW